MLNQLLFQFICMCLTVGLHVAQGIKCYSCWDTVGAIHPPYDPDCGAYDYNDSNYVEGGDSSDDICYTTVYWRYSHDIARGIIHNSEHSDGDCYYGYEFVDCYCSGDYCNTGNICEHCFKAPTESTTEIASPVTPITTTTTEAPEYLRCYSCIDCTEVNGSTHVVEYENLHACITVEVKDNGEMIRSGTSVFWDDGYCRDEGHTVTCYCTTDLCNGKESITYG